MGLRGGRHLGVVRSPPGLGEQSTVGAGAEVTPGSAQHERRDGVVVADLRETIEQFPAGHAGQGVAGRGVIDGDDRAAPATNRR